MTSRMLNATANLFAALVATLCIGMATTASAAIESSAAGTPAAEKPLEELEQLAEIQVRGKRLARVIEDAEDDFFKLYNKVNKEWQYDIFCGTMRLNGSLIMTRKCVPSFLIDSLAPQWSSATGSVCTGGTMGYYAHVDASSNQIVYEGNGCFGGPATYSGIAPAVVTMQKREAYFDNLLKVINSDPRLKQKVRHLDSLYEELQLVQGRFSKVRAIKTANAGPGVARPKLPPR